MPRLPRGLYKRGQSFYMRDRTGGRDLRRSLGTDRDEAIRRFRQIKASGRPLTAIRTTMAEAAKRWLATRIATGRNEKGQKLAAARVRLYLDPFMGHVLLEKLTNEHLREYRLWLERRGVSIHTVRHILGDAVALLRWSEEAALVDRAPVARRLLPRIQESLPDPLTEDEAAHLAALPDPHGFVIRLGLGTGLRWAELCRSRADHVQNGALAVSHTKSRRVRRVPLEPDLLREMRTRVGRLVPFSEKAPGSFSKFVRRHGGVCRFHPHRLRDTFGCNWLARGGSLAALQELMGHASIVTTQRYARLMDDLVRREVERVAKVGERA